MYLLVAALLIIQHYTNILQSESVFFVYLNSADYFLHDTADKTYNYNRYIKYEMSGH